MFRNYFTVALRNIIRHRLYSFINIAGLAVGLTCLIFVILFVRDELSYDKWVPGDAEFVQAGDDGRHARPSSIGDGGHPLCHAGSDAE